MFARFLLLALALVASSLGARLPYIIGGNPIYDNTKWPWQCSLGSLRGSVHQHSCGAVIISETWLVTAAHCISTKRGVRCGSINRRSGGLVRKVLQSIKHPSYDTSNSDNDVAVVRIDPLTFSDSIKPIKMANTEEAGNNDCWITGWGYITVDTDHRPLPSYLYEAKIQVYTNSKCEENWGSIINAGHVCVGNDDQTRGSCNGDSGGPLVCKVDGEYQLLGVTSFGNRDCSPKDLSVYTRIPYFRSWISSETGVN